MSNLKIQYASDLHLEMSGCSAYIHEHPLVPSAPVLLLAGDIHVIGSPFFAGHRFWDWCADNFERTVIVPGNHEYYGGEPAVDDTVNAPDGWRWDVRDNVTYVNNRAVTLPDLDLTVLATTLWSPVDPLNEPAVNTRMNDCRLIRYGDGILNASGMTAMHRRCLDWLGKALNECHTGHKVVLTHHCPAIIEDPRYGTNNLSSAFVMPLEHFVESSGADAWVFGHTHYNAGRGRRLGSTTLLVNQLGYAPDDVCPDFDPAATFTLPAIPSFSDN